MLLAKLKKAEFDIRYSLKQLKSKVYSLKSIRFAYRNWLKILKTYYLGGADVAALKDPYGNMTSIVVNKDNVSRLILLARALYTCKKFEVKKGIVNVLGTPVDLESTLKGPSINKLYSLCLLVRSNAKLSQINDKYALVEVEDTRFIVRKDNPFDIIEGALLPYYHEPYEYRWFSKIVRRGSLFVDVGAYIGGYSIRACRNGARVIAIEPDKENFKLLQRNLNINNCDAYAFNVAAGSREGVAPFYASAEGYSPDRYSLTSGVGKFIVDYVKVLPIDQILSTFENNTSKVDLVKIDVEGFENDVLIGMRDSFKKIRYIMVEVMPETMKPCLHTLKEGFKIIDMCKHSGEDMVWYNVLLRHK